MKVIYLDVVNGNVMQMEIDNDLHTFYDLIGCRVVEMLEERIGIAEDYFTIICDEEALLKSNPIPSAPNPAGQVKLFGNLIICGTDLENCDIKSLTDEECDYIKQFIQPVTVVNDRTHKHRTYFMLTNCTF